MEKRERERERDPWEEERQEFVTVRCEERKSEKAYHEREKVPKNYVSHCYR